MKTEFGPKHEYSIAWSGTGTHMHVSGPLSSEDIRYMISMLHLALETRSAHLESEGETTQLDPQNQ